MHVMTQWRIQGEAKGRPPIAPCNHRVTSGSGDFWCINACRIVTVWGTVTTFVACYYKHDICISRIVIQNTIKCAISKAKISFFSAEGHNPSPDPRPHPEGRGYPSPPRGVTPPHTLPLVAFGHSPPPPLSRNPGSAIVNLTAWKK